MATYSSDLTTAALADSDAVENWTEFSSANTGGTPADDDENLIQGVNCQSQTTGTKSGTTNPKSVVYQHGSDLATGWTTGDAFFIWHYYAVGANLYDYDQTTYSGLEIGISNDTTNVDRFFTGGGNVRRNPYGGWDNVAVDPEITADETYGTGGAGYTYIGGIAYTINAISKGTPHACDAIRYGRGEISVTGTGGSFSELAEYNDYNAGGTPPGTSSTSIDSGRHRLGLFSSQGGTYLWKGLMSLGLSGTSVTFTDSNTTIIIEDVKHSTASFNKVEVNNVSSSVTLTNVTFISTSLTPSVAKGDFEAIDNATIAKTGCSFNDMGSFIYQSNSTLTNCVYNACGLISTGGGIFDGCAFNAPTGAVGVTASSPANASLISNSTFDSDGTGNGLEITGTAANFTLTGVDFTGYSTTVDANKAIFVNIATGSLTISITGGTGVTADSHVRTAGATVTVAADPVVVKVTATQKDGTPIQSARVLLRASDATGDFPFDKTVTIANSGTTATVTHTTHGVASNDYIQITGASLAANNGVFQVTVSDANTYTYTMGSTPGASPTGTIKATFVALYGTTDVNGEISTSRVYATAQPVTGWTRKSTTSPYFQEGVLGGEVSITTGYDSTAVMVSDE